MTDFTINMDSQMESVRRGGVQLPLDSAQVTDADEEVFLLYSELQSSAINVEEPSNSFRGLGHVDSRKDTLTICFDLKALDTQETALRTMDSVSPKKNKQRKYHAKKLAVKDVTVEINLAQDKTALRSRKGDTGSVLWKASVDFAQLFLQQVHAQTKDSLFDRDTLLKQHILELGSGTGLLGIALSPHVRHYTATDIQQLTPLMRKNATINFSDWPNVQSGIPGSNLTVEELDWHALRAATVSQRSKLLNIDPVDLLLVVDCIYHPSLLPSLVETIDYFAVPNRTTTLLMSELRADDVIREFLDLWLQKEDWEIWRVGGDIIQKPYVMWIGWKV